MAGRVLFLAPDLAASFYRTWAPALALRAAGHKAEVVDAVLPGHITGYDTLAAWTEYTAPALMSIDHANNAGVHTVYELEDDWWSVDPSHPGHAVWADEAVRNGLELCISRCRKVVVTTEPLAARVSALNAHVEVIPNLLPDWDWLPADPERGFSPACRRPQRETMVAGWGGSASHRGDLAVLSEVVPELLAALPQLEIHVGGMAEYPWPDHPRIKRFQSVSIQKYPKLLSSWDIGLAPLAHTAFNESKSDLKVLEYSMAGLAVVASDCSAYREAVVDAGSGLLAASPSEWFERVKQLVEDAEARRSYGKSARAWAEKRLISNGVGRWESALGLV